MQVIVHGGLQPILGMARVLDDVDCQRFAVMALNNLAANEENHHTMITKGALDAVIQLASSPDEDVMQYAAFAIANFASNAEVHSRLGRKPLSSQPSRANTAPLAPTHAPPPPFLPQHFHALSHRR